MLVTLFADFSALGVAAAVMVEVFAEVSWPDASLEARNREVKNPRMSAVNGEFWGRLIFFLVDGLLAVCVRFEPTFSD